MRCGTVLGTHTGWPKIYYGFFVNLRCRANTIILVLDLISEVINVCEPCLCDIVYIMQMMPALPISFCLSIHPVNNSCSRE